MESSKTLEKLKAHNKLIKTLMGLVIKEFGFASISMVESIARWPEISTPLNLKKLTVFLRQLNALALELDNKKKEVFYNRLFYKLSKLIEHKQLKKEDLKSCQNWFYKIQKCINEMENYKQILNPPLYMQGLQFGVGLAGEYPHLLTELDTFRDGKKQDKDLDRLLAELNAMILEQLSKIDVVPQIKELEDGIFNEKPVLKPKMTSGRIIANAANLLGLPSLREKQILLRLRRVRIT